MEAANSDIRKRARDEAAAGNTEILQPSKKECSNPVIHHNDDLRRYQFHDGIGVFDFPWLKDGVVFEDHEDKFAPCSYLDDAADTFPADCHQSSSPQNLSVSPAVDGDDDSFLSLQVVDDLEPVDCIWSCVIDQPLLDVGSSKG